MANDDQRHGHPVTSDTETAADTETGADAASPAAGSEDRPSTGATDRPRSSTRPVRTAPMRRRGGNRKTEPPQPGPETGSPTTGPDTADSGSDAPATVEVTEKPGIEPDPSDVEKTISYRERRQARLARESGSPQTSGVRYRGARKRSVRGIVAVVVSLLVIVGCVVASTLFAVGISRQDRLDDLRAEYSSFASQVLVNLTSMNPDNVDSTLKTVQDDTSGKVKQQVQENIKQVAALVRDGKLETSTYILSEAVTRAEPDEGSVIMVFGWHQKSLDGQQPAMEKVFRWRVDITRINGELKMTDFEWVA